MSYTKPSKCQFSPRWNTLKRTGIQILSEVLQTYRHTESHAHSALITLFRDLLSETEFAEPDRVRELQQIRLRGVLKSAYRITWWKEHFTKHAFPLSSVATLDDLAKLPPVTKDSFTDVPRAKLLARFAPGHDRIEMHRTSGTTGTPFEWAVDRNVLTVETASYLHRALSWYGIRSEKQPTRTFMATFVWNSYGSPAKEMHWSPVDKDADKKFHRILQLMRTAGLRVLFAYPTNLFLFAQKVVETEIGRAHV